VRSYLKNNQHKKGWWNGSSDASLPSKCKTMSSAPSTAKQATKKSNVADEFATKETVHIRPKVFSTELFIGFIQCVFYFLLYLENTE
jgi:hypothetical protein